MNRYCSTICIVQVMHNDVGPGFRKPYGNAVTDIATGPGYQRTLPFETQQIRNCGCRDLLTH
jgi:hypothetical protein